VREVILDIFVPGHPKPKGSMRAFQVPGGKTVVTSSSTSTKAWGDAVRLHVASWATKFVKDGPVAVALDFVLPRPKSAPKTKPRRWALAAKKPDIDKLERAIFDALTGVIWGDDSQVVETRHRKRVAWEEPPGVHIIVETIDPETEIVVSCGSGRAPGEAAGG
jgi:crossover junction endodeoxyribonuclease RusA